MNTSELISKVVRDVKLKIKDGDQVREHRLTKKEAGELISSVASAIADDLQKGGKVHIAGLGQITPTMRSERKCRNPKTQETIIAPAKMVYKFKENFGKNKLDK